MLVVPKDASEGSDEEDTDTDTDSLEGGCVHYTADLPIVKDLAWKPDSCEYLGAVK